jgi:DNA end-binding protein Ku
MYSAVARRNIALREIRESDSARIKHRRVAEGTDEEVPYENIVKAYELSPGQYVPLNKDGAEKAYSLLAAAMESSGKAAISRFVFRNKEHLSAIRASEGVLTLTTMRFHDEVVPPSELDDALPDKKPKVAKREQQMAEQLIDSLSTEFEPDAYKDEYREQLLALIEQKAEGKEIVAPEAEAPKATKAPDLMAALEESIAAVKEKGGGDDGATKASKPKAAKSKKSKSSSKSSKSKSKSSSRSKTKAAK